MIFNAFERMVALRYLRARREEGFVSVIAGFSLAGIALGVATLIIVMSVMNGFRAELLDRILGLNGHMGVYSLTNQPLRDFDRVATEIKKLDGVIRVIPTVEGQVLVSGNRVAAGAIVRGVRESDIRARKIISDNIRAGTLDNFKGKSTVIIGTRMAQKFGVRPGDTIRLVSPQSNATAFGSVPRSKKYTIAALFEVGMFEYDSGFVFMPLEAAQIYFQSKGAVTNIEVFLDNPDRVNSIRIEILRAAGVPLRLVDWQQANASFFNAVKVERNVMFLILTLIILVAAFNIISGMIMMVKDKGRDIAILRTMGADPGHDHAYLPAGGRVGRHYRHSGGVRARCRLCRKYRNHSPVDTGTDRCGAVRRRNLLPVATALRGGNQRCCQRRRHVAGSVLSGNTLPGMAGCTPRSRGSAAL